MNQQHINAGQFAFDASADTLRDAMLKTESNFIELYDAVEDLQQLTKPPLILRVSESLPCRPDKNGLYLLDRKKTMKVGGYSQYKELYRLHFGRNTKHAEGRIVGGATFISSYQFYNASAHNNNDALTVLSDFVTLPVNTRIRLYVNIYTRRGSSVQYRILDDTDSELFETTYQTHYQHKTYPGGYKDYVESAEIDTAIYPTVRFECTVYDCEQSNALTSVVVRHKIDVPAEFENDEYVLARWTGSEWKWVRTPFNIRIPLKDSQAFYYQKKIHTPKIDFPRLVSVYKSMNGERDFIFEFDRPLKYEYNFVFSRYKTSSWSERYVGDFKRNGTAWELKRYATKTFKQYVGMDVFISYGALRGHVRCKDYMRVNPNSTELLHKLSTRLEIPFETLKESFFRPNSNDVYSAAIQRIRNKTTKPTKHCYWKLGFQLCKKVNGKYQYSEMQFIKIVLMPLVAGENLYSKYIQLKLYE